MVISKRLVKHHNIDMLVSIQVYLHLRAGEDFHLNPEAYYNAK